LTFPRCGKLAGVSYRYNAGVVGETREELENAARAEAEEYFGTTELDFVSADVSMAGVGEDRYSGTFRFEVKQDG
jgi:hypothetical protein